MCVCACVCVQGEGAHNDIGAIFLIWGPFSALTLINVYQLCNVAATISKYQHNALCCITTPVIYNQSHCVATDKNIVPQFMF